MKGAADAGVTVSPVAGPHDLRRFIGFPPSVYRRDPGWVRPFRADLARRLDPARNPFYAGARRELFLARRGDAVVGTVAAIIDDARNRAVGEATGYFGFFETVDESGVVAALLDAAAGWLSRVGATAIRGPLNGSSADEIGVLIEGFGTRPRLWQGHHRPYYRHRLEEWGLAKVDDLLAYELTYDDIGGSLDSLPGFLPRRANLARAAGARVRSPTAESWARDLRLVHRLYVDSHRSIAGHGGMSFEQFASIARAMRRFVDLDLTVIAEAAGEPAGFAIAVPDVNEALAGRRATPWEALSVAHRIRRVRGVSVKVLGVLPRYRGRGLGALLCEELGRRIVAKGYRRCDMSLVSERNTGMTSLLNRVGARIYRRYRVYQAPLPDQVRRS